MDKSESIDECSKLAKEVESETSANDKNNNCEDLNEQSYAKLQCPHGIVGTRHYENGAWWGDQCHHVQHGFLILREIFGVEKRLGNPHDWWC